MIRPFITINGKKIVNQLMALKLFKQYLQDIYSQDLITHQEDSQQLTSEISLLLMIKSIKNLLMHSQIWYHYPFKLRG